MRHPVPLLLALVLLVSPLARSAQADELTDAARAALEPALGQIIAVLRDDGSTPDEKRALIERELDRLVDFAFMSRMALGARAERFSAEERVDFAQEYERHLAHYFISRLSRFRQDGFEITDATHDASTGIVSIRALGDRPLGHRSLSRPTVRRATVTFGMRLRRGEWRIVSLAVDGVDISQNFREQFRSFLERNTPGELTEELRRRNAVNDERNPFAA